MSNWCSKRVTCSSSTPVRVLKPGDLDGRKSPKEKSESPENRSTKNRVRCSVLSRIFSYKSKVEGTKVKKVNSDSPAVSSVDGAHCTK